MIYKRSRTVEIDHNDVVWTFKRPPGSVLLGWAPQVAELSKQTEAGTLPITPERYRELLDDLSSWLEQVNGAPVSMTGEQLDGELLVAEGLHIWANFFMRCQMGADEAGKSERLSA